MQTKYMLPKIAIVGLVIAVAIFVFKDKLPINQAGSPSDSKTQSQQPKNMTFDEVLALGGTCFTNQPFIDETKDVEASVDGEGKTKAPDKDEYDINRITVGRDGDSLISMWEFVGEIGHTWLNDHNININTYHDSGKEDDDRFQVSKDAHSEEWTGTLIPGNYSEKTTSFEPQVKLHSNAIQFSIPWNLISQDDKVDNLAFMANFYQKPTKTMYSDTVWPPVNQRVAGHFTSFYCPKK